MSETPERIWAWQYKGHFSWDLAQPDLSVVTNCAEYVRADRIEELEGKLARSERHNEALEELRPVWAQGWTGDSQAAQVSSSALAQLWEMLGASNQTQAVEALAELRGDKE